MHFSRRESEHFGLSEALLLDFARKLCRRTAARNPAKAPRAVKTFDRSPTLSEPHHPAGALWPP
jgi:hypothetical protein